MLDTLNASPGAPEPLKLEYLDHGNKRYGSECDQALRLRRGSVHLGFLATWGRLSLLPPQQKFVLRDPMDAELAAMGLKPKDWPHALVVMAKLRPGDALVPERNALNPNSFVPLKHECFMHVIVPEGFSPLAVAGALQSDHAARRVFSLSLDRLAYREVGCSPLLQADYTTQSIDRCG